MRIARDLFCAVCTAGAMVCFWQFYNELCYDKSMPTGNVLQSGIESNILQINPKQFSLGRLRQSEHGILEATISNDTNEKIDLMAPVVGCGCLNASCDRTTLLPGESAVLTIDWKARTKRGAFVEEVVILAQGERKKTKAYRVRVEGQCVPEFVTTPETVSLDSSRKTATIKYSFPFNDYVVSALRTSCDKLAIEHDIQNGCINVSWKGQITTIADRLETSIVIYTTHPQVELYHLPITISP